MPTEEEKFYQSEDDTPRSEVEQSATETNEHLSSGMAALPPGVDSPYAIPQPVAEISSPITWSASEYVTNQKTHEWYLLLALAAALITGVTWLLTREIFPTAMVAISLALLGVYAAHQPQEQHYSLDNRSLTIGNQQHFFNEFRSFAIVPEGAFSCIELTPHKRFAMYTAIYYDPKDEETIVSLLSTHLPMEEPKTNIADSLMRRIHF